MSTARQHNASSLGCRDSQHTLVWGEKNASAAYGSEEAWVIHHHQSVVMSTTVTTLLKSTFTVARFH